MKHIEKSLEVDAPLHEVYHQWTKFEDFPQFMSGVKEVRRLDDRRLFWRAEIGGEEVEWEAEIGEQVPDERIAWRNTTGHPNSGTVHFAPAGYDRTTVTLALDYQPLGVLEAVGDAIGILSGRIEGDLLRFREFIENRGQLDRDSARQFSRNAPAAFGARDEARI